MKRLYCFCFLVLFSFIMTSCGDDIDDLKKIDGDWKLQSISGGIAGGGFPFEGEITMNVNEDDLTLFQDNVLIMEADLSYEESENAQLFLKLDANYLEEMPTFILGVTEKMVIRKIDNQLSLFDNISDGYSFEFVKI